MFSSKKHPKLEVIIGNDTIIKGEISSKGTVRIDGRFEGNVTADSIIVGGDGTILGDIATKSLIAAGRITGNVHSTESVEIQPKGEVCGDIYTQRLTVADGGVFEGRSYMQKNRDMSRELEYKPLDA
jgi:cytoskeletal protein CcmA (bactofilin family)